MSAILNIAPFSYFIEKLKWYSYLSQIIRNPIFSSISSLNFIIFSGRDKKSCKKILIFPSPFVWHCLGRNETGAHLGDVILLAADWPDTGLYIACIC